MRKKKQYKSEALMVIHQSMEAVYRIGAITAEEMREFDEGCLVSETAPSCKTVTPQNQPVTPAYG